MKAEKLLVHACCAPCLTAPQQYFTEEGWQPTAFFFNPNIHPLTEYVKRRDCLIDFCRKLDIPLHLPDEYRLEEFLKQAVDKGNERCRFCYSWRLEMTARYAKQENFPYFTTTLLVSPYQKHELIKEIGLALADEYKLKFLYHDLRVLWPQRGRLTSKYQLYRQKYCGCIYSEKERFMAKLTSSTG